MKSSNKTYIKSGVDHGHATVGKYRWHFMGATPLKFDVKCGDTVVIPAGTKYVGIAFGQSHLTRIDEATGKKVHLNVYRVRSRAADGTWQVKTYHA